jgi:chemotaxis protein methyltransferase CheR
MVVPIAPSSDPLVEIQAIEIELLLEAVRLKYGYDFRNYARAHVKRRVLHRLALSGLPNVSALQHQVLAEQRDFELLLLDLSINVTEMFRDPTFYLAVRTEAAPLLKTWPFLKIWHAGCASGEEVYSMAILLIEEELFERTQLYATDFNQVVIQKAKEATYPIESIKEYTANYQKAGGQSSFAEYYTAKYDSVILDQSLKKRIVFADHNLVTDGVFGEMNMIVCRNVLIYFNRELQNRVISLFYDSLCPGGFLCLGSKESLKFSDYAALFEPVVEKEKIYKKRVTA